jgi:hypothetical protein
MSINGNNKPTRSYPESVYGILEAEVANIPPLDTGSNVEVDLALIHGLHTTSGKDILIRSRLEGRAEILIDNRSILMRMFSNH